MSIDPHPDAPKFATPLPPSWGEITPVGVTATVVRFLLEERVVTLPTGRFKRWEHTRSLPESLVIGTDDERIIVEGRDLNQIRVALDLGRLSELRVNHPSKSGARPGPRVWRIAIEAA